MRLPDTIVHADWSVRASGRWCAVGRRVGDRYEADVPAPVGEPAQLLEREAGATRLLGLDLPIGLPLAYADAAGITDFRAWLAGLGRPPWHEVDLPALDPREITPWRPFYPAAAGVRGSRRADLAAGLGVAHHDELLRECERPGALVRRPSSVFWLVGANQVGRAAVRGWLDLLVPALTGGVALWPFDGDLGTLLEGPGTVVAETYPAQCARAIGAWPVVKSRVEGRRPVAPALLAAADRLGVTLSGRARAAVVDGFPNDDAFDAFVGLLGLVDTIRSDAPVDPPAWLPACRTVEGWIVGAAAPAQRDRAPGTGASS